MLKRDRTTAFEQPEPAETSEQWDEQEAESMDLWGEAPTERPSVFELWNNGAEPLDQHTEEEQPPTPTAGFYPPLRWGRPPLDAANDEIVMLDAQQQPVPAPPLPVAVQQDAQAPAVDRSEALLRLIPRSVRQPGMPRSTFVGERGFDDAFL